MFEKFITNPDCMKVVAWLLNHSEGEYAAAILGVECEIADMTTFMAIISILEGVHIIKINDFSEDLTISLDKEQSITQLLMHFREDFNDQAFRSDQVSPALSYLTSDAVRKIVDGQIFEEIGSEKVIDLFKNYEELDLDDSLNREVYNICTKLKENDEYEDFIEKLENHK